MGETRIDIQVLSGRKRASLNLLVDTGATLTVIPEKTLKNLRIKRLKEIEVELADGRVVKRDLGVARILLDSQDVITRVIFGKKSDTPVLGTVVLEELGLAVDPIRKRLVPVRFLFV